MPCLLCHRLYAAPGALGGVLTYVGQNYNKLETMVTEFGTNVRTPGPYFFYYFISLIFFVFLSLTASTQVKDEQLLSNEEVRCS